MNVQDLIASVQQPPTPLAIAQAWYRYTFYSSGSTVFSKGVLLQLLHALAPDPQKRRAVLEHILQDLDRTNRSKLPPACQDALETVQELLFTPVLEAQILPLDSLQLIGPTIPHPLPVWEGDTTALVQQYYQKYNPQGLTDEAIGEKIVEENEVRISKGKRKGELHDARSLAKMISDLRCKGKL